MTKNELSRFHVILTARVAELERFTQLERFTRQRDGIVVERSADQLEEIQAASQRALAVCNLDREPAPRCSCGPSPYRGRQLRHMPGV